ncbi:AAA family ATPase, partial [Acinetobacter pittii]|uniref:AAA family ATPase n=1 Tax=Acinetobacter pittii TaxID=48296 RepID=UPI000B0FF617
PQSINIEEDITVLVGMNESGKTSVLECLAKTNYFEDDEKFKFNETLDGRVKLEVRHKPPN